VSSYNTFYDVGTRFSGTPTDPIIYLNAVTNCSAYDLFARTDSQVNTTGIPRIQTLNAAVINIENGSSLNLGNYQIEAAVVTDLPDNTPSATLFAIVVGSGPANDVQYKAFTVTYTFRRQTGIGGAWRTGVFTVISNPALTYVDDYTENLASGLTFSASQGISDTVTVTYTTTNTGYDGELTYSISHLA